MTHYDDMDAPDTLAKEGLLSGDYSTDEAGVESDTMNTANDDVQYSQTQHRSRSKSTRGPDRPMRSSRCNPRKGRHTTILIIAAASAFVCLALLFAFTHVVPLPARSRGGGGGGGAEIRSCGNSSTEAAQRRCGFDVMLLAWVPQPCLDGRLSERYRATTGWAWRDDPLREGEVSNGLVTPEEMLVGPDATSTPRKALWRGRKDEEGGEGWVGRWEFHLVQCAYAWEIVERAFHLGEGDEEDEVWVIPELYLEGAEQARHCGDMWSRVALYGIERERDFVSQGKNGTGLYTCAKLKDL
ncbi:hypothetical protein diail_6690 [Diaporthe ilicicola]|nr:hypothetical protein diail_6690 [Diaporthe ilicicola]